MNAEYGAMQYVASALVRGLQDRLAVQERLIRSLQGVRIERIVVPVKIFVERRTESIHEGWEAGGGFFDYWVIMRGVNLVWSARQHLAHLAQAPVWGGLPLQQAGA